MDDKNFHRASFKILMKKLVVGLLFWVLFNILSGSLQGEFLLFEINFILLLVILYISLLASYNLSIEQGVIVVRQAGMVTSNINLYEASDVKVEKDRLLIIYPNDIRYSIKLNVFDDHIKNKLIDMVVPHTGERPPITLESIYFEANEVETKEYIPNKVPLKKRASNIFQSVLFIVYGGYSFYIGSLYIPGRTTNGVHLSGLQANLVYISMILAVLGMISTILDHYDKRDNERMYNNFTKFANFIALLFLVSGLFMFDKSSG